MFIRVANRWSLRSVRGFCQTELTSGIRNAELAESRPLRRDDEPRMARITRMEEGVDFPPRLRAFDCLLFTLIRAIRVIRGSLFLPRSVQPFLPVSDRGGTTGDHGVRTLGTGSLL